MDWYSTKYCYRQTVGKFDADPKVRNMFRSMNLLPSIQGQSQEHRTEENLKEQQNIVEDQENLKE